ncbi:unnamed protein product [Trichobilharzia szidati]|nr:unnamed protein product [Trichobilharzia szidati]
MNKKKLYLATSLEELKKLSKINIRSSAPEVLKREMSLIKCQANEVWEHDEERAYVLFMKYFEYYDKLRQITGKKDSIILKDDLLCAVERAETLHVNLKARYKSLKSPTVPEPEKSNESPPDLEPEKPPPTISPRWVQSNDLAEIIKKQQNFLLMDVRTVSEFEQCHIAFENIINIPCDILQRGATVNTISDYLKLNSTFKKLWENRGEFDGIILLDENGFDSDLSPVDKSNCLQILKDAIFKWDAAKTITIEPKMLVKGMKDFALRYPPLLIQAVTTSSNQTDAKRGISQLQASKVKYPDLNIREIKSEDKLPTVNLADLLASQSKNPALSFKSIQNGRGVVQNGTNPGVQRPPPPPKPPAFTGRVQYTPKMLPSQSSETSLTNLRQSITQLDRQHSLVSNLSNLSLGKLDLSPTSVTSNHIVLSDSMRGDENRGEKVWKLSTEHSDEESRMYSDLREKSYTDRSLPRKYSEQYSDQRMYKPVDSHVDPWRVSLTASTINASIPSVPNIPPPESKPMNLVNSQSSLTYVQPDVLNNQVLLNSTVCTTLAIHQTRTNGLRNLGNTCYMNSVVQCLSHTRALVHYFLDGFHERKAVVTNSLGYGGEIVKHFEVLLSALYNRPNQDAELHKFRSAVAKHQAKFSSNDQQDSLEFLLFLLDGLHEDLNEARSQRNSTTKPLQDQSSVEYSSSREQAEAAWIQHKDLNNSIIVSSFQGLLRSTVKCSNCHKTSITFDVFMVLSLPMEQNNACHLTDCLKLFLEKEEMVGPCRWHCPTCNTRRDASKWIELWKLPTYLIIHLKRFRYEHGNWRKQTTNVNFPIESLDMSSFIVGPKLHSSEYALFAVLNHRGTMESGHYTTYCRNIRDGRWYEYDDENVSLLSRNEIQNDNAYILFYELLPRVGVFFENPPDVVR